MQLLLAPFSKFPESFVAFLIAIGIAALMVFIFLRAASTAEGRPSFLRRWIRLPNTKILFTLLFIGWAVIFGVGLTLVPSNTGHAPRLLHRSRLLGSSARRTSRRPGPRHVQSVASAYNASRQDAARLESART